MGMFDQLIGSFTGPVLESLGAKIGLPSSLVKSAIPIVTGLVIAGLNRMAKSGGPDAVANLLSGAGDQLETSGGDLTSMVNGLDLNQSSAALQALAGGNSVENLTKNIAGKIGMDAADVGKLLACVTPVLLGSMGKMAKDQGLDAAGISNLISENVDSLGPIANFDSLLDNTPGIGDDISRGLKRIFGG